MAGEPNRVHVSVQSTRLSMTPNVESQLMSMPLSAVRCPLSAVRCPLSAVRCPLSAVQSAVRVRVRGLAQADDYYIPCCCCHPIFSVVFNQISLVRKVYRKYRKQTQPMRYLDHIMALNKRRHDFTQDSNRSQHCFV